MTDNDLPPSVLRILRNADSEAKRLCHGRVTPLHVAEAIRRRDDEDAFSGQLGGQLDAALAALPTDFNAPVHDDATMELLQKVAAEVDPEVTLKSLLTDMISQTPAPSEPDPTDVQRVAEPLAEQPVEESAIPQRLQQLVDVAGETTPSLPRLAEVHRIIAMLGAREPQPVLLLSDEGGGGSTLADCLAAVLNAPGYDGPLAGHPVFRTKTDALLDATSADIWALGAVEGDYVVFVDDVEVLLRLGGGVNPGMVASLRALIEAGRPVVFALGAAFFDRLQSADMELTSELEVVRLPPLSDQDVLEVAQAAAKELTEYHHVEIPESVVALSAAPPRQIDAFSHPGLAVARLDRAAAAARLRTDRTAAAEDLGTAVSSQQYLAFDAEAAFQRLSDKVLGQDDAVRTVVDRLAITRASLDMRPERPDGVFLFAGPTGTGKTALALALADEIYGSSDALIRLDMSEFSDEHTVSKLYGSPPGFVGSTEPEAWLTTKIRKRPQALLLLDEIEKAHPLVWNAFLQVFDSGAMTDSQGRTAEFSDVVIVLTTNIGAEEFQKKNDIGFADVGVSVAAQESAVREELKRRMRPELLNRLDGVMVFHPLEPGTIRGIARDQLATVLVRLQDRGWTVTIDRSLEDLVVEEGYDPEYGARPMIRALERLVLRPIAAHPAGTYRMLAVEGRTVVEVG